MGVSETQTAPITVGQRARAKVRRRSAIQRAGLSLFAERGYDETTLADIAAAAEVAPRTISAYFPTKLSIATSVADDIIERLTTILSEHPELDFLETVDLWLREESEQLGSVPMALDQAVRRRNPELAALLSGRITDTVEVASAALARQVGRRRDDQTLQLAVAAASSVLARYLTIVNASGETDELFRQATMRLVTAIIGTL